MRAENNREETLKQIEGFKEGKQPSFIPDPGRAFLDTLNENQREYITIRLIDSYWKEALTEGTTPEQIIKQLTEPPETPYDDITSITAEAFKEALIGYNTEIFYEYLYRQRGPVDRFWRSMFTKKAIKANKKKVLIFFEYSGKSESFEL